MRFRSWCALLGLFVFLAANNRLRAEDDDPEINGTKLSKLVEQFKAAKTPEERSNLAFAIASGAEKAKSAIPVLVAALKDKDKVVQMNVVFALSSMGPAAKSAVPGLLEAVKDKDADVRREVITALGVFGSNAKAAIPVLSDVVKNKTEDAVVRAAAASSLGRLDAKDAIPLLKEMLTEKDGGLRVSSAHALYTMDKKENAKLVLPVLREILKEKNERVQTQAINALQVMGADANDAVPELMAVLVETGGSGMVRYYAQQALGHIPAAEAALVAALKSDNENLRSRASSILVERYPEAAKKAGLEVRKKK